VAVEGTKRAKLQGAIRHVWRQAVKFMTLHGYGRVTTGFRLQPVVSSTVLVGSFWGGQLSVGPQSLSKKGRFQQEFCGSFT
jgi:hypothetical protein